MAFFKSTSRISSNYLVRVAYAIVVRPNALTTQSPWQITFLY